VVILQPILFLHFLVLNHLDDISENSYYADLIGFTQEELENNQDLQDYIEEVLELKKKFEEEPNTAYDLQAFKDEIKANYDNYQFSSNKKITVYNPYSLLKFLQESYHFGAKGEYKGSSFSIFIKCHRISELLVQKRAHEYSNGSASQLPSDLI
jgi:hypothetical protein